MKRLEESIPLIYIIIAVPAMIFFAFAMPPFQNPDESGHFMRAYQVSNGIIMADVRKDTTGGVIDTGLRDLCF